MSQPNSLSLNFILSTGRTGSTLLSTMLNMHPNIISTSEEPFAYNLFPKYKNKTNWTDETIREYCFDFFLFSAGKLEPQFGKKDDLYQILKEHQAFLTGELAIKLSYLAFMPFKDKSQVNTIVDKELKSHFIVKQLSQYYPQAKFIVLTRDPRDNALVKRKRDLKKNQKRTYYLLSKIWDYEYASLLKKLARIDSKRYIIVKYEDLVSEPEKTLSRITQFLSLTYNSNMLNYDSTFNERLSSGKETLNPKTISHLEGFHAGLGQKVSTDKVGIWQKELSVEDKNLIWYMCQKTAQQLNYQREACTATFYFKPKMILEFLKFLFIIHLYTKAYHLLPYFVRYRIRKTLYSKRVKETTYALTNHFEKVNTKVHAINN